MKLSVFHLMWKIIIQILDEELNKGITGSIWCIWTAKFIKQGKGILPFTDKVRPQVFCQIFFDGYKFTMESLLCNYESLDMFMFMISVGLFIEILSAYI